jgi:hypothetical protein
MKRKLILILLFCFCFSALIFAQGKTEGLPISVKIKTPVAFSDGSVEIIGESNSLNSEPGQVLIEIITPNGKTDNLSARADKQSGEYYVKYMPKEMGQYKVIAYAADKVQTANATFNVLAEFDADEIVKDFDATKNKVTVAMEAAINSIVAAQSTPEDKAKAKQEVAKVKVKLKEFDDGFSKIKKALKDFESLAKKHPDLKAIAAPQLGQLGSKLQESSDLLKQVEKDFGKSKANEGDICNRYYRVAEGCALFSTTMNFASGGIVAISKSIFIDKVWPKLEEYAEKKVGEKHFTSVDRLLLTQAGKTGLSGADDLSSLSSKSFGAGMIGDLVQFASNELFKKYCTEYKGPINGDYELEFKNNGKMYMRYKLTYEGKISLYCSKQNLESAQKATSSKIPKFSGYIEGNVTKVDFTDDVWAVEDKSDWDEIKNQRIPAPVIPANISEKDPGFGAVARAATPGSFYFPIEGQMVQEKMIIKLMGTRSDFTDAFANRTIVVVKAKQEPHNVTGAVFNYPITTARFILTRSMRMADASPTVTIPIKTKNGVGTIENQYSRTETPNDTKVVFNLKLKMSNE